MITDISVLDINKKYSYAEYLKWQFKERVELIKGKIFKMTPAPSRRHQKYSFNLGLELGKYLEGKSCDIYSAPFDVRFPIGEGDEKTYTVVQPDICVICDKNKLDEKGCVGAPGSYY
jgi:Uma2 family endonuclease